MTPKELLEFREGCRKYQADDCLQKLYNCLRYYWEEGRSFSLSYKEIEKKAWPYDIKKYKKEIVESAKKDGWIVIFHDNGVEIYASN